jgi:hypothetical protein
MQPSLDLLPRSLREAASAFGMEYLTHTGGTVAPYPVACRSMPLVDDPVLFISSLPVQMNFTREVLDMDKQEDREEYNRIMTYYRAGYGMQMVYHARRFVIKKYRSGDKIRRKEVQRIYIEYYAPYRVLPSYAEPR